MATSKTAAPRKPTTKKPLAKPAAPAVVIRKISAPTPPSAENADPALSKSAMDLATQIEALLKQGNIEALSPQATQGLFAALCKLYRAHYDAETSFPIVADRNAITGTDAMVACGALLKAVDLQVFELGMWQSWTGR